MFVTAIMPPGNILAAIAKVKADLFAAVGFASLYALPSIVPVALSSSVTPVPASHSIIRQPAILETTSLGLTEGLIVLNISNPGIGAELARILATPPAEPGLPFSLVDSIVLGVDESATGRETDSSLRGYLEAYPLKPLRWRRSTLVCFELFPGAGKWWDGSGIEYVWRRPLKSPRDAMK